MKSWQSEELSFSPQIHFIEEAHLVSGFWGRKDIALGKFA